MSCVFWKRTSTRSKRWVIEKNETISENDLEHMNALYDEELAFLDECVGDLLRRLEKQGLLENTMVVILADHGESLTERHLLDHGRALYGESINIPMLISYPEQITGGLRVKSPV